MSAATGTFAGLLLAHAGMSLLCLAMDRHYGQVFKGQAPSLRQQIALRVCAVVILVTALVASRLAWGMSVGWVMWLGLLTAGALLTASSWSAWPRAAAASAPATALAGMTVLSMSPA